VKETRATYFSIDIECSGTVPGYHDVVSIGAVAVLPDASGRLGLGGRFYVEIRPVTGHVDARALDVTGLDYAHLLEHGALRRDALLDLTRFVERERTPGTTAVFVGHNAPFDWSFVSSAYGLEGLPNPFGYKALDTKALASGALGLHWLDTTKERLHALLPIPKEDLGQKHRADYDALYQAHILLALLARLGWATRTEDPA
jgi:DNA polymerase III epsilon subunit-like protein